MRRLFMLVVAVTVPALSLLGCGSDSDASSNNGGSSGAAGGSSVTQCVGNNAEFTHAEFVAQTQDGKACSEASDVTTVCANNMPVVGGTCGKGCLGMDNEGTCVAECIQDALTMAHSEPLSVGCLTCYVEDVGCARDNCLAPCGLNPSSEACFTCRTDKGCVDAFYECSGLPEPGGG